MHDRTRLFVPLLLVAALAACDAAPPGDKPGSADTASTGQPSPPPQDFPDTEIGRLLTEHMLWLAGQGNDAEAKYQMSLTTLRAREPDASRQLIESYPSIDGERFFRRWAVLETLRELHDPSSLALAAQVAETPLPEERFTDDAERSSQDEELRLRVKAAEIVAALAADRVPDADAALLRLVRHPDLGVRRTAIRGYLAAGGLAEQSRRGDELRRLVSQADYALITLETTEVRTVPHPDLPAEFELGRGNAPEGPPPNVRSER